MFFFILISCKLQDPLNNHGINFLKNRSEKLIVNKSNKNDVIKIIGQPHSKSINNKNEWFFIERTLTKGEYHKLGKNVLKFSKKVTSNEITKKSFVERFLSSIKTKMYGQR